MTILDASNVSLVHAILGIAPIAIACLFHGARFAAVYLFRMNKDPFYDPFPMYLWSCAAFINFMLVAAGVTGLVELLGSVLMASFLMLLNHDFGTNL